MIVEVNLEELNKTAEKMAEDYKKINDEIEKMLNLNIELRNIWKGQDSEIFFDNYVSYLLKLKSIPRTLSDIQSFIQKAKISYYEGDINFALEIRKAKENYE